MEDTSYQPHASLAYRTKKALIRLWSRALRWTRDSVHDYSSSTPKRPALNGDVLESRWLRF